MPPQDECRRHCGKKDGQVKCSVPTKMGHFLEPCLLLLLSQESSHGYALLDRVVRYGFNRNGQDVGTMYRILRRLEREDLVTSEWETDGGGPAKRLYVITEAGRQTLSEWSEAIQRRIEYLSLFLDDYETGKKKED